jgi:hypothetical protein
LRQLPTGLGDQIIARDFDRRPEHFSRRHVPMMREVQSGHRIIGGHQGELAKHALDDRMSSRHLCSPVS